MDFKKYFAELIGTFIFIFCGCGVAVFSNTVMDINIMFPSIALSFGLSYAVIFYIFGRLSGSHLNPVISISMTIRGFLPLSDLFPYLLAQFIGAMSAMSLLYIIVLGSDLFITNNLFFANGFALNSPGGFSMLAVMLAEIFATAILVMVVLKIEADYSLNDASAIIVGFTMTILVFTLLPLSNASLNPWRSLSSAIFNGGWALEQVWVFLLSPLIGGLLGVAADWSLRKS